MIHRFSQYMTGLAAAACVAATAFKASAQDLELGEKTFKRMCAACHVLGGVSRPGVGPNLAGVVSSPAGSREDFQYSGGMNAAARAGLTWTEETLDAFLKRPGDVVPSTRMTFRGMRDDAKRSAVIAYLASFSETSAAGGDAAEGAAAADNGAPAELLAIEGDVAYGEYLSTECTTCHQLSGNNDGIPSIVGWPKANFLAAMHGYRSGTRVHPVMQMVAQSLGDEELAALAAYFSAIKAEN